MVVAIVCGRFCGGAFVGTLVWGRLCGVPFVIALVWGRLCLGVIVLEALLCHGDIVWWRYCVRTILCPRRYCVQGAIVSEALVCCCACVGVVCG